MLTRQTDRRGMLRGMGQAGLVGLLAPEMSFLRADRAKAAGEPLTSPPEIRSWNGELSVTLTAAPSRMRLADVEFPDFSTMRPICRRFCGCAPAT